MNTLKIKKLHPHATMPKRVHAHDAGMDIYAAETIRLRPQKKHLLHTHIAVDIPPGYVGFLTSRSGVSSKTNLVIETGKIDAGYMGEIKVNIKNAEQELDALSKWNNDQLEQPFEPLLFNVRGDKIDNGNPYEIIRGKDYLIQTGDKIAQLIIVPIVTPSVKEVEEFEHESERAGRGFGSTGHR